MVRGGFWASGTSGLVMPDICSTELAIELTADAAPAAQPVRFSTATSEIRRDKGRIKASLYSGCKNTKWIITFEKIFFRQYCIK
jgi:hypothetical protein